MKVKALTSFVGVVSMGAGEVRNIEDQVVLDDLIKAKYVESVEAKPSPAKTEAPKNEPAKETKKKGGK